MDGAAAARALHNQHIVTARAGPKMAAEGNGWAGQRRGKARRREEEQKVRQEENESKSFATLAVPALWQGFCEPRCTAQPGHF